MDESTEQLIKRVFDETFPIPDPNMKIVVAAIQINDAPISEDEVRTRALGIIKELQEYSYVRVIDTDVIKNDSGKYVASIRFIGYLDN